ncbi:MAG: hypothetical protein K2O61_06190 [Bacteroidaceae bacterium]|nr:hypothetical protein [Bacteroidaceae bacterium]
MALDMRPVSEASTWKDGCKKKKKMAGIKDILDIEQERNESKDWLVINLFQEGSFYRAYEVSAWLCHTYICQFKVTHRHVNGIGQAIAFVGFPVSSLEKRTPQGAVVASVAEKHIILTLPPLESEMTVDEMKNEFVAWKSRQPVSESKGKSDTEVKRNSTMCKVEGNPTLFSIAQGILSYSIESHSPIECMLFLSDVKKNLAHII